MKRCSKCKTRKEFTEFYRNRVQPDGYQVWCKLCVVNHQNQKRASDPERYRRYQKDWFARHPGYFRRYNHKRLPDKGKTVVVFADDD